jgi:hypothetical protein
MERQIIGEKNYSGYPTSYKHPKCKGVIIPDIGNGVEYDCEYGTTITCDECKYCAAGFGRKDPKAKCNQPKN